MVGMKKLQGLLADAGFEPVEFDPSKPIPDNVVELTAQRLCVMQGYHPDVTVRISRDETAPNWTLHKQRAREIISEAVALKALGL